MRRLYSDFVFAPEALKIFKKIILSCISNPLVLQTMKPFFLMTEIVTLENTKKFIQTATETMLAYKLFHPKPEISVEDVIMAFADIPHWNSMTKLYDERLRDIWIELFALSNYQISHIIKPVCLFDNDGFLMKYYDEKIPINFFGVQNFSKNNIRKIQLIHFGLVVYETDDQDLIEKIIQTQRELLRIVLVERLPMDVFYTDNKLSKIYQENISFYNSLKI